MEGKGTVTVLQRALEALGLDALTAIREIDGYVVSVSKARERYSTKATRLEDSIRAALRKAAAGGKERGDPRQLALGDTTSAKPLSLSLPPYRRDWTVGDAQDYIEALCEEGVECPCCGQLSRLWKRKLNSNMAVFLISLVRAWNANGREPVHHTACSYVGRDYPLVARFGLACTMENDDDSKRTSGMWEPTSDGVDFVHDRLNVRRYVLIFDNRVIGFTGETIGVREALGDSFNYRELLEGIG